MRFFKEAVPMHFEKDVFVPGCRPAPKGSVDQRTDDVPDFRPALAAGAREDYGDTWCGGRIEASLRKVLVAGKRN